MESQGLSEGSLRSSHRETHAVKRKPAPASLQNPARKILEEGIQDLTIRQRLDPVRAEPILKKGTFYVLENEGRAEPGYLVLQAGRPAVLFQRRRGSGGQSQLVGSTLRLRVSAAAGEGGGSVLIVTMDDVLHTLRLEDVWIWRGAAIATTEPFSRRREILKEFVERHWVPDARLLGGVFATVATYMSLEAFSQKGVWDGCSSVEFVPEQPGRRRMLWVLESGAGAGGGPAGMKQDRVAVAAVAGAGASAPAPAAPAPAPAPSSATRKARAVAVDKMPDVYDLYVDDGPPIGRASVQSFAISQQLRAAPAEPTGHWVTARWRADFGGYEIISL